MNIGAVREAIADTLDIPGVNVSPYVLAQPTPPGIQIIPPSVVYDYSMGASLGLDEWMFIVQGFVALTTDIGAQMLLDDLCAPAGSSSVKALLEADRTLGGLVETLHVTEQTAGRQVEQPAGNPMLLVEWRITIHAKGA